MPDYNEADALALLQTLVIDPLLQQDFVFAMPLFVYNEGEKPRYYLLSKEEDELEEVKVALQILNSITWQLQERLIELYEEED